MQLVNVLYNPRIHAHVHTHALSDWNPYHLPLITAINHPGEEPESEKNNKDIYIRKKARLSLVSVDAVLLL